MFYKKTRRPMYRKNHATDRKVFKTVPIMIRKKKNLKT